MVTAAILKLTAATAGTSVHHVRAPTGLAAILQSPVNLQGELLLSILAGFELVVGVLVLIPRTRRIGLVAALVSLLCYSIVALLLVQGGFDLSGCRCLGNAASLTLPGRFFVLSVMLALTSLALTTNEPKDAVTDPT